MSFDPIHFNDQSIESICERVDERLKSVHSSAAAVLAPPLHSISSNFSLEELGEEADFASLVSRFRGCLDERLKKSSVSVSFEAIENLDFGLNELASFYGEGLAALKEGLLHWQLDQIEESHISQVRGLLSRFNRELQTFGRDVSRLDEVLRSRNLEVNDRPWMELVKRWTLWRSGCLNLSYLTHLEKEFVELLRTLKDVDRWRLNYLELLGKAQKSSLKLKDKPYQIFATLSTSQRERILDLYLCAKMDEVNEITQRVPEAQMESILKKEMTRDLAFPVFEAYYEALDQALFEESRILKEQAAQGKLDQEAGRDTVELWLEARRKETHTLKYLIYRVREFLLRTDPDPYVHTRMGWHDRQLGPEPKETQPLQSLSRALRKLDSVFYRLSEAVHEFEKSRVEAQWKENVLLVGEIFQMIKTLNRQDSEEEASYFANELLKKWSDLDEVCSFNKEDVSYDELLLRKALIYDGFQVLLKKEMFKELYRQHLAIRGPFKDQEQQQRLKKIREDLQQGGIGGEQLLKLLEMGREFLQGIQSQLKKSTEESVELNEEVRKQILEYLYEHHHLSRKSRKVVLSTRHDRLWQQISQLIHELDQECYRWEQGVLLGVRS